MWRRAARCGREPRRRSPCCRARSRARCREDPASPGGYNGRSPCPSGFHTQAPSALGLDLGKVDLAAVAAADSVLPGLLEPAELLGLLLVMLFEQAQRLAHD